ncbi:MAG: electron transport complex subunit E [Porticoccaceae bacterium]|jgi:electron transport complex protein RnfE|nr:electron transport complex subunit E [Porticoccaceae bacterium]HLS98198.1 electron transport complex subunit E [Porticoccaceae bacterium]
MSELSYREIARNGLWTNNPALVQILGLCPLLAVSSSVVNALGLGLATLLVLAGSNLAISLIRRQVSDAVRIPVFVMIIATFTTCAELLMKAYTYELYQILGIFIALIVTNCVILGRAEAFASKHPVGASLFDGAMMGLGFCLVLVVIGGIREALGSGTLLANMQLLFGPGAAAWKITLFGDGQGLLLAILPPGAFMVLGFLIALKNVIDAGIERRRARTAVAVEKVSRRVRTTGAIS